MAIKYIDRETTNIEEEKVAGERYLKWLYEHPIGMGLLELLFKKKLFSYFYGKLQDRAISSKKIAAFVKDYEIDMTDYKIPIEEYRSFNDFFYRELKEGARPIDTNANSLICPADGRLLAYANIDIDQLIQVKGSNFSLIEVIGDQKLAQDYRDGFCFVLRLCPIDYHRFHFPANGIAEVAQEIKGDYYSVNPIALRKKAQVYCRNKRQLTLLHSDIFDDILLIEVGATCVGTIVQTYASNDKVAKGEEKGYFKYGGSTVIMFLKSGTITVDEDLICNTLKGMETKVKMGMSIAQRGVCKMPYDMPLYRPPSEAESLILQITHGCSHNKCTFCSMYKTKKFRLLSEHEIEEHISWAKEYDPMARRIFLADGNALAIESKLLEGIVQKLYKDFPNLERVTAYAGPRDILEKTEEELKKLQASGITMLYLGVESGSEEVLKLINKGVTAQEMIEAGQKARKAGFALSCTIILGLGGRVLRQEHAQETARVINGIEPEYLGALTLMVEDITPLASQVRRGEFNLLEPKEIIDELSEIIHNLDLKNCVFRSNHASNYLALKGILNQDKEMLLNILNDAKKVGDKAFRPEGWRGL